MRGFLRSGLAAGLVLATVAGPLAPQARAQGEVKSIITGFVGDVRLDPDATVMRLGSGQVGICGSPEFVFERDRGSWRYQTERMLQAMRSQTAVAVEYLCTPEKRQRILALSFVR